MPNPRISDILLAILIKIAMAFISSGKGRL